MGVLRVLRALDAWLLKMPDDLHRISYEYLQDAAAHQVRYADFFWNQTGTARDSGIPYAQAQAAIVRAIADAQTDCGIVGRLVPAIDREATPAEALEMVEWLIAHRHPHVPGIGIDYREVDRPPELLAEAYAAARRAGLKTTAHAGEFGMPWTNVQAAVELLKVDRIDHGYTIVDNPKFAQQCAERGIVFTVVPTNSYYLRTLAPERWALDHPIRRMNALGLRIHPNTDDPTLHHVTPTQAWHMMVRDFGFELKKEPEHVQTCRTVPGGADDFRRRCGRPGPAGLARGQAHHDHRALQRGRQRRRDGAAGGARLAERLKQSV